MSDAPDDEFEELPAGEDWHKWARGALQVAGSIPFAGGAFSAMAGAWSEKQQEEINDFIHAYLRMMRDAIDEQNRTFAEIVSRIDAEDERARERIKSPEYQRLMRKAFRNWAGAESETKRELVRNILTNAAGSDISSYDVLNLFLDWLHKYSELHFRVISDVYQNPGTTKAEIWERLGKGRPRDDSAEADLFKLLFHDLNLGEIIRKERQVNADGQFLAQPRGRKQSGGRRTLVSAFEDQNRQELTALGTQFVHYAMTDVPVKINYKEPFDDENQ
ncbi:MAG: hypothetical protein AAGK80_08140 [Pseudomonadota bacterium]